MIKIHGVFFTLRNVVSRTLKHIGCKVCSVSDSSAGEI